MVADKVGRKALKLANITFNAIVMIVVMLLAALFCYILWDLNQIYGDADASHYEMYKPTKENKGLSFQELQEINPEVFAWITIYGTNIDYPVAQGKDNLKYMNINAKGDYSLIGSIYLDNNNKHDFSDFSNIIYGHHMERNAMFGNIGLFSDKEYFDARRYGNLYYDDQEHGLEFFALVHTDAYDYSVFRTKILGQKNRQAFLGTLFGKSLHIRKDVNVTPNDRLVLLTTCAPSTTNGRDVLIGRITNEIYDDNFKTEYVANIPVIDELASLWLQIPIWIKILIIAILILLIMFAVVFIYQIIRRKRHRRENR